MALVKCRECKRKISDTAQFCPHCGYNYRNAPLEKASTTSQTAHVRTHPHKVKNKLLGFWEDIVYALETVWSVIRGLLLGILTMAGVLLVIFLFLFLVDWLAMRNLLLARIVGFIGFAVFLVAANIACFSVCYKEQRRHKWFFWVSLIASATWYIFSLFAVFG